MGSGDTQAGNATRPHRCSKCGYDLTGIGDAKVCPECEWELAKEHPDEERSRFSFQFLMALSVVIQIMTFLLVPASTPWGKIPILHKLNLALFTLISMQQWIVAFRCRDRFGEFPWIAVKTWPLVWLACGVVVLGTRWLLGFWP